MLPAMRSACRFASSARRDSATTSQPPMISSTVSAPGAYWPTRAMMPDISLRNWRKQKLKSSFETYSNTTIGYSHSLQFFVEPPGFTTLNIDLMPSGRVLWALPIVLRGSSSTKTMHFACL